MASWAKWVARARLLKAEAVALALAARDPRTPLIAKLMVLAIVAYAVSPIDLIPDFIPVLGYLDELVLLPIAISFAIRMIPAPVMEDARARAPQAGKRAKWIAIVGATVIVAIWVFVLWLVGTVLYRVFTEMPLL